MLAGKIGYFRASFDPRNLPGLVAYWPMNEDASLTNAQALDVSGNGFHLTSSGALSNPGRNGSGRLLAAQGGQWNPSPARLSRGSWNATPQWDANATGWSVAFWLFTDLTNNTQGTGSTAAAINFSTIASASAESVRFASGQPVTGFPSLSSRCYFTDNTFLTYQSGGSLPVGGMTSITPQGQWTHMAFVADPATRTYTMFVNGVARTPLTYAADKVLSSFSSGIPCLMQWPGTIDEVVVYNRAISASEVLRLAGVPLSASSPSALHPECRSWISRVLSNGGTVSTTTANAVNDFCAAIDAAGIRDRFYRLNLFCGTGLAAALVPLYRGQSLGGTQFGNSTDTNVNFAAGDYVETGSTGGLKGNGTSKYLNTGFAASALTPASAHSSAYVETLSVDTTANKVLLMAHGSFAGIYGITTRDGGNNAVNFAYAGQPTSARTDPSPAASTGLLMGSATSTSDIRFYANGSQTALNTNARTTDTTLSSQSVFVFAANASGAPQAYTAARMRSYSCGLGMTAAQASAYYTALQAFQTALGRNV